MSSAIIARKVDNIYCFTIYCAIVSLMFLFFFQALEYLFKFIIQSRMLLIR